MTTTEQSTDAIDEILAARIEELKDIQHAMWVMGKGQDAWERIESRIVELQSLLNKTGESE